MKALILICILISIQANAQEQTQRICHIGGYNYTGLFHSDSWQMTQEMDIEKCKERKDFDEDKAKQEYEENLKMIDELIGLMLEAPKCTAMKEPLTEYQQKLRQHKVNYDRKMSSDTAYLKTYFSKNDVQREFAYVAAYRSGCDNEHHRITSFIDLDMINRLPQNTSKTRVERDGQIIDDCGDVEAFGDDDLKEFTVSLAKAKGSEFLFSFDPYGVPDQLILSDNVGTPLYDSGCTATRPEDKNIKIPLSKLSSSKKVKINVINNCSSKERKKGESSWEFQLKCQQDPPADPCHEEKLLLSDLLKNKVSQTKVLLDNVTKQRLCLNFLDETVLKELAKKGVIVHQDKPSINGRCAIMDVGCEKESEDHRDKEK